MSAQQRDTAAVLRRLGWRRIAGALLRRAGSDLRRLSRSGGATQQPADASIFAAALRAAPSLAAGTAPVTEPPTAPECASDPRLRWEAARGRRLVALASRRAPAFEPALLAFLAEPTENDPLETALRAWNLGVAASLQGLPTLGTDATRALASRLVESARFVEARLEDRGLVVGSHLIGELLALEVCGLLLHGAGPEPAAWRARAQAGLAREARVQVLPDGGGAEGSSGYGRFVAELWIAALSCARAAGAEPSPAIDAAARNMLTHLADTLPPDGGDLGIGDDDSSIVLPGATDVASIVPLLALWPLAERPAGLPWSPVAEIIGGPAARARWDAAREVPWRDSVWAPSFGLALARRGGLGGDMVVLRAGPNGQSGVGGHAHNDALSVSIWLGGRRVVDDPGTGIYLGRPALRERFRGVAAHATICVDGLEPSALPATRPFALPDTTRAHIVSVEDEGGRWRCVAEHTGYVRTGVRVRRELRFEHGTGDIEIVDTLEGSGVHRVVVSFPLASAAGATQATLDGDTVGYGTVTLRAGTTDADKRLTWRLDEGSTSPRYGIIETALVARRVGRVELPVTLVTNIARTR
jgi:Heparinase II/III-like protein